ncbi:MAG: hypothetical protein GYB39_08755 [Algicola sp.]|nr:hypothetical protein [Algicola sp.]
MKTKILPLLALLFMLSGTATAQKGINYKALIKDNSGNVVANQNITIEFSILEGPEIGFLDPVYIETHTVTTDANGIVIANIGEGNPDAGYEDAYETINWGSFFGSHFLKVQIDTGSGLTDMGTTEFKAVPYALYAENSNNSGLEAINEGNGTGRRLIGMNPENYGPIANFAVDLSYSPASSSTRGATGDYAAALGYQTTASGYSSFASGVNTMATGTQATAMGAGTVASGNSSTALGIGTRAEAPNTTAIGLFNVGGGDPLQASTTDPLFEIGNGQYVDGINDVRTNALTVLRNGTIIAPSFEIEQITDPKALITKEYADANYSGGGTGTSPTGLEALNEGNGTGWRLIGTDLANYGNIGNGAIDLSYSDSPSATRGATGALSLATGFNTVAFGENSTAMGFEAEATGLGSISIGNSTVAYGFNSTAMGDTTVASGNNSFASGISTEASGYRSTAMGYSTMASGDSSTALGYETIASGYRSTALGYGTEAIGGTSTALGSHTIATGLGSLVAGKYNIAYSSSLFQIGNGLDDDNRSNAFTVLQNGNVGITVINPRSKLHITGGTDASYTNTSGYMVLGDVTGDNIVMDSNEILARNNGAASGLYLQQSGGDVYAGGAVVHSSDRRLKRNIETLPYGLEEVLQLAPKQYYWKNRGVQTRKSLGLIAQEVQPIINEIVHEAEDKDKTLSVSYTELIPVLIKAIQEQQAIIDQQAQTIQNQETANTEQSQVLQALLERVEALEKQQFNSTPVELVKN